MKFDLANFKPDNISRLTDDQGVRHPFTVQKCFEIHKLNQASINLISKKMSTESSANDESECVSTDALCMSSSKSSSQHEEDKGTLWRQFCRCWQRDQQRREKEGKKKKKEEDNDISLWLEYEDVQWLEETRKAREIRVPPEPAENVPRVRVYVRYCIEGDVSRIFQITESMMAVYDWVGSLSLFPENFCLRLTSGRSVQPMEAVSVVHGSPPCHRNNK